MFERLYVAHPHAHANAWLADRDGIFEDSRRGFGGQSRTALNVFDADHFNRCQTFGWITSVRSEVRGAARPVLEEMITKLDERGADVVGLMVLPDDDRFIERLTRYYGTFGFEVEGDEGDEYGYPVMVSTLGAQPPCVAAKRSKRSRRHP